MNLTLDQLRVIQHLLLEHLSDLGIVDEDTEEVQALEQLKDTIDAEIGQPETKGN